MVVVCYNERACKRESICKEKGERGGALGQVERSRTPVFLPRVDLKVWLLDRDPLASGSVC